MRRACRRPLARRLRIQGIGYDSIKASDTGGDLLQFERRVHQHRDRVYGFACYFLGDREAAQDVTQEVLIRLWKHHREVDETRLVGWLLRVTRNACIDALRRRRSTRNVMDIDTECLDEAAAEEASPGEATEAADFQRHLRRALDRLHDPYRSIVILREVQDLKYEEISDALGLPLNTVKVYLHRGRKMLREQLSEVMHRETV